MSETDFTPRLGLPYLLSNQAQKHVTLNESLRALDGLLQLSVLDRDLTSPPPSPMEGDRYLVASGGADAWAGEDAKLACFADGGWLFFAPATGWRVWVEDESVLMVHDGADWRGVTPDHLQNLSRLGVGTLADAGNPLSAKLNGALFTALAIGEGGTGDLRLTLNKEAPGNVLSLLLQDGYSARAEIGLPGDDDLVFKVSPDGSAFYEGIRLDGASGRASFPSGVSGLREKLSGDRTYYVDASAGADSNDGLSVGTAFATIQKAMDVVSGIDLSIHDVTVQLASGTYDGFTVSGRFTGQGQVSLRGDPATPGNCVIENVSGSGTQNAIHLEFGARMTLSGVRLRAGFAGVSSVTASLCIISGSVEFDSCARSAIWVDGGGAECRVEATVTFVGDCERFVEATHGGLFQMTAEDLVFSGTRHFSKYVFDVKRASSAHFINITQTGSATGTKYRAVANSLVNTNGAGESSLPGDVAGSLATDGVFA